MNNYRIPSPRKAFAAAAIAMTAITMSLAVVVPARMGASPEDVRTLAPIEVVATPARIEVVRESDPEILSVQVRTPLGKRKQES